MKQAASLGEWKLGTPIITNAIITTKSWLYGQINLNGNETDYCQNQDNEDGTALQASYLATKVILNWEKCKFQLYGSYA